MAENAQLWPVMDGTYLQVEGCLGTALMGLLLGNKIMDGFVMVLETGFTFVLVNVNGWGGGGGGGGGMGPERADRFKQFFVSDVDT